MEKSLLVQQLYFMVGGLGKTDKYGDCEVAHITDLSHGMQTKCIYVNGEMTLFVELMETEKMKEVDCIKGVDELSLKDLNKLHTELLRIYSDIYYKVE